MTTLRRLVFAVMCVACATPLFAQAATPAQDPSAPPSPTNPKPVNVRWEDGLIFETPDTNYRLQIGSLVRFDGRFVPDDPQHLFNDTFTMRFARLVVQAKIAKYFTVRIIPDFVGSGGGIPNMSEAFMDVAFSPKLHVRVGRDRSPFSYEVMLQDPNVLFLERSLPVNLAPNRDIGAQVLGDLAGGALNYQVGVFNGVVDGTSSTNLDTDSAKDVEGRLVVKPFMHASPELQNLGFAVGATRGTQVGTGLPTFRTSAQQAYFSYDSAANANGTHARFSPQVFYNYRRFATYAEYARSTQTITKKGVTDDVTTDAWGAAVQWMLTGEAAGERVRPRKVFDPEKGTWGALALVARYGGLTVGDSAFTNAFAAAGSSQHVNVATVGAIWVLTPNVKVLFDGEHSVFDHNNAGARPSENAVLVRFQLNFF